MRKLLTSGLAMAAVLVLCLLTLAGCGRSPNLARLAGLSSDLRSVQLHLSGEADVNDQYKRLAYDVLSAAKPVKGNPPFDFAFGYGFILEAQVEGKPTAFIRGRADVDNGVVHLAIKVTDRATYFTAPLADLAGPFPRILPIVGVTLALPNEDAVRLQGSFKEGAEPQAVGMHRGADWTEVLVRAGPPTGAGWRIIPVRTDWQRSAVTVEAKTFAPSSRVAGPPSPPTLGFAVPGLVKVQIILDGSQVNVEWVDER